MSARVPSSILIGALAFSICGVMAIRAAAPSPPAPPQHQHEPQSPPADSDPAQQHDTQHMHMGDEQNMAMPPAREGSGTSWLPDETPMYAVHSQAGKWTLMAHGNAFLQYLHESGDRGSDQGGSINWFMGMADRNLGSGHLGLRGMISLEPWTIRGCGYADLSASGEVCRGATIHDRQHPHDLFMELAATYDRPLAGDIRLQLYGGPVGEPALGPTAFPHRISAMPNPLARITHHWFSSRNKPHARRARHVVRAVRVDGQVGPRSRHRLARCFHGRETPRRLHTRFRSLERSESGYRCRGVGGLCSRLSEAVLREPSERRARGVRHASSSRARNVVTTNWRRRVQRSVRRNSWALTATTTVLSDIRTAPIAAGRTMPQGASAPAANGIAKTLYPAAHHKF